MIQVLSYRDQRILKMCEMLILNSEPVTVQEFMEANNSSLKTVYDDLDYLKVKFNHILHVAIDNGNVSSEDTSIGDLMAIRKSIFYKNLAIRIYATLYFEKEQTMNDFIDKFHYSKSKIRKEISRCNEMLKHINVAIEANEGVYTLKAEDESVLAYLASLVVLGSGYPDYIYEEKAALIASSDFEKERNFKVPSVIRDEILLADALFKKYSCNTECPIYCAPVPEALIDDVKNRLHRYGMRNQSELCLCEDILRSLYFKMSVFKKQSILSMQRYQYFYYQFSQENSRFVLAYEKNIRELQERWNLPFSVYQEELLFLIYIHFPHIREYKRFKIAVYSDLGCEHAQILLKRLEKNFQLHDFEVFDKEKDYDLVLSTAKHDICFGQCNSKVLTISDFLTPDNYRDLYHALYMSQS